MTVCLIQSSFVQNSLARVGQYTIVPSNRAREGHVVGHYFSVAEAYQAGRNKGAPFVYLHSEREFPIKMFSPDDLRGETWMNEGQS